MGHLKGFSHRESHPRVEKCQKSPTGQHDASDECHVSESSQGNPIGSESSSSDPPIPPFHFGSVMRRLERTSWRTSKNMVFI